jgi:dienelactone hydrolase
MLRSSVSVTWAVLLLTGCAKDLDRYTAGTGVSAVFDPTGSPPAVPTPTDLVRSSVTGLLQVPVANDAKDPTLKAQAYFDTYLNTLNGYPTSATAEMRFDGVVDEKTVTKDTVLVYSAADLLNPTGGAATPLADLVIEHRVVTAASPSYSLVRIWNYAGWTRGTTYVIYVLGGDKGVKDPSGKPVLRSASFELATSPAALCAWDSTKSWDAATQSCATPAAGTKASGCCTFNYSSLVESKVKKAVRDAPENLTKDPEEVELLVKSAVLSAATSFERLRQGMNKLLGPLGTSASIQRDDVALLWAFSTVSMNEAVFDPASTVPRIPTPTDLLRDPKTGMVTIPVAPTASDAEKEFTTSYLNTLDGFTPAVTPTLDFAAELDTTTATASNVLLFEVGATSLNQVSDAKVAIDATAKRVTITRPGGFKRGATHVAFAVGGDSGLKNKDTTLAAAPKRSGIMQLALSPYPLCTFDAATKACTDAKISSIIDDPASKTGALTAVQKATKFETIRQGYDPLLKLFEATGKGKREGVVALWTFTITSQTEVLLDPVTGVLPFPNNMLLDPVGLAKTPPEYKVNIPAQPGETATEKALREQLNTFDGFSTQGALFAATSGLVDKTSLQFGVSAVAFNLDKSAPEPILFDFVDTGPAIVATPSRPLDEKTQYGIVLLSKLKAGQLAPDGGGLKDPKGQRVIPATFMALLRSKAKLLDVSGRSTVSLLSDAQATLAEPFRAAMEKFFDGLEANPLLPIKRADIVAAWTFRTQTITEKLPLLRALPWSILGAVDSNQPKWTGTYDATLAGFPTNVPSTDIAGWIKDGLFTSWNAIDEAGTTAFLPDPTKGKPSAVPFLMTIPKGTMPATGWPVAVYQHGIFDLKTDALAVANSLAKGGIAMISFDVMYHGDRTWCTANTQCTAGGTCAVATGTCSTSLVIDPTAFPVPGPAASGARFLWTDNPALPLALRDNMRQYVIDGSALLRGIALPPVPSTSCIPTPTDPKCALASGPTGITSWGTNNLDRNKVYFVGQSLGSMLGTLLMATDPLPTRVNFNVPGAPFVTVARTGATYRPLFDGLLKKFNVTDGTLPAMKLINILTWILDPADSGNYAAYVTTKQLPDLVKSKLVPGSLVPKKTAICQLATNDQTVPKSPNGDYFAAAAGVDTTKTTYTGQGHGMLLEGSPDQKASDAAQTQMTTFFTDGTICTPNLTTGTCN